MKESTIANFWEHHPCGEHFVGGLEQDYQEFFQKFDSFRYTKQPHILNCLDQVDFKGKKVLEIGLGQGADSEQIISRGGEWSDLDLTPESVKRVRTRMKVKKLPFDAVKEGTVLDIPYESNSFDIVFSHGVLHHVPDILQAQKEIHRVLRPNGELIMMLYAKNSLNYLVSIKILRRLGLAFLYFSGIKPKGIYSQHLENARKEGLLKYLKMENFIHRRTDGPPNPYSKVYDLSAVRTDFPEFRVVRSHKKWTFLRYRLPTGQEARCSAGICGSI